MGRSGNALQTLVQPDLFPYIAYQHDIKNTHLINRVEPKGTGELNHFVSLVAQLVSVGA